MNNIDLDWRIKQSVELFQLLIFNPVPISDQKAKF